MAIKIVASCQLDNSTCFDFGLKPVREYDFMVKVCFGLVWFGLAYQPLLVI